MATNNEENRQAKGLVSCMTCKHGSLHRYGNNPILAECKCKPQPGNKRFPYLVEVASTLRKCSMWEADRNEKVVELRKHSA